MSEPSRLLLMLNETQAKLSEIERRTASGLQHGDGGGTSDGMDQRVTRLETHMEYVRTDLADIKADQKTILAKLETISAETIAMKHASAGKVTVFSTGIAIVAIIIGVMAFGGDRFDGGLNASSVAEQAAAKAIAASK